MKECLRRTNTNILTAEFEMWENVDRLLDLKENWLGYWPNEFSVTQPVTPEDFAKKKLRVNSSTEP